MSRFNFDSGKIGRYLRGMKDDYHHGDLRRVLLEAAEAELTETGIEAFSLRKVAKRAGVSHAAPAHHFKDANGLLTALAEVGYRRFVEYQQAREQSAENSPRETLIAQGLGYVDFGIERKALFRLMFSSSRPNYEDVSLADSAEAAFKKLVDAIAELEGRHPYQDEEAMRSAATLWSTAHGLADLISSGRMGYVGNLPKPARDKTLRCILENVLPDGK